MILSLQNNLSETQAQSRPAVLRQGFAGQDCPVARSARRWHRAYRPSQLRGTRSIFGGSVRFPGKPGGVAPALSLAFPKASFALDMGANAKPEGTP